MKPLDQFKRTPPRRYDKAPPPPPGDKRTLEPAIRKRYFDVPTFDHRHIDRWLGGAVCAVTFWFSACARIVSCLASCFTSCFS